jgi:Histone methylation protein DOT1
MGIVSTLKAMRGRTHGKGPGDVFRYAARRLVEYRYERHFGIHTATEIQPAALGIDDVDAVHYAPTPYDAFFGAIKLVDVDMAGSVFVDYGSGLGRIVICAATLPFRRVIGVELAESLNRRAGKNLQAARRRLACEQIQLVHGNAAEWRVPHDVNVVHFYNPFLNETLRRTVAQLARSLRENPRELWIVFGSPWQMSRLMAIGDPLPLSWQKGTRDLRWPFYRDISATDPHGYRYRVYRIDSR